jgi:hypothetical protein
MTEKQTQKIETLKTIVADHQCAKVEGVLVDATTANVVVQVFDALNETNKAKFAALPVAKMANLAWKFVK